MENLTLLSTRGYVEQRHACLLLDGVKSLLESISTLRVKICSAHYCSKLGKRILNQNSNFNGFGNIQYRWRCMRMRIYLARVNIRNGPWFSNLLRIIRLVHYRFTAPFLVEKRTWAINDCIHRFVRLQLC